MKHLKAIILAFALALACVAEASAWKGPSLPPEAMLNGTDKFDWDLVPRISDKPSLAAYIHACVEARMERIPVVFDKGFYVKPLEVLVNYMLLPWSSDKTVFQNGRERHVLYKVRYYPGMRVADAYRRGSPAGLYREERRLYEKALPIVQEAMQIPNLLERELFIHDRIISRCSFTKLSDGSTETMPRHTTALGVLLDGRANCQGYSDAFYMLGRMCGLQVEMMAGRAANGGHTWNTIELGGRTYIVDLTWNDESIGMDGRKYGTYIYFNAPREIAQASHQWDRGYEPPNLAERIDGKYFYCAPEWKSTQGRLFGSSWDSPRNGLEGLAASIARNGWKMNYAMVPYDAAWSQSKRANKYLLDELERQDWYGDVTFAVTTNASWKWMFYTIDARHR